MNKANFETAVGIISKNHHKEFKTYVGTLPPEDESTSFQLVSGFMQWVERKEKLADLECDSLKCITDHFREWFAAQKWITERSNPDEIFETYIKA